jgi:predicted Zn finger-like uncharacterized protein
MIAACPECAARYRVDEAKLGAKGARMRCAKCSTIFRIPAPESTSAPAPEAAVPARASEGSLARPGIAPGEQEYDAERLVVVATGQAQIVDATVSALEAWGLQALAISHGAEAMLAIQRTLPRVVVLDTALPGMDGLQICEVIKRNESLRKIRVILIADSPDSQFVADLGEFGPDARRARANLLDDLHELMSEFELPMSVGRTPSPPSAAPAKKPTASPADGLDQDRAKAERLARIVISDIVLYQGEAFDRANLSGTLVEDFAVDLAEGRQLLSGRVDARVCKERDHLVEELMRVAEERRKD